MDQSNLFIGHMLGDGSIGYRDNHKNRFSFGQKINAKNWVEFSYQVMRPFTNNKKLSVGYYKKTGKSFKKQKYGFARYRTCLHEFFTFERQRWYKAQKPHANKIIPKDIKLNWEIAAAWFADDGCNSQSNKCIYLHTQSFSKRDNLRLIALLKSDLSVTKVELNKRPNHKWCLRIGSESYYYFLDSVRSSLAPVHCLDYKVDTSIADKILDRTDYLDSVRYGAELEAKARAMRASDATYNEISAKLGIGSWKLGQWFHK